jgi:hypothetical protein
MPPLGRGKRVDLGQVPKPSKMGLLMAGKGGGSLSESVSNSSHFDLVREIPEAMKPRAIPIASFSKVLEVQPTKLAA